MIIEKHGEGYDGSFRVVVYRKDDRGRTVAESVKSDMDDQIPTFYVQRREELARLVSEVLDGKISPIALFMQYENMTLSDLSARIKLSSRRVKKHLAPAGFKDLTVEVLQRYARIFDVAVCDFFQFLYLDDGVSFDRKNRAERLFQTVEVAVRGASGSR
jgi:hypothetical protein